MWKDGGVIGRTGPRATIAAMTIEQILAPINPDMRAYYRPACDNHKTKGGHTHANSRVYANAATCWPIGLRK